MQIKHFLLIMFAAVAFAASPTLVNRTGQVVVPSGNASFGGPYEVNWQAVPATLTAVTATTAHITGLCFYNSTGGAIVMTVQTGDASPLPLPLSGSLAAGASACFSFSQGLRSNGGFSVQAGSTGVYYTAVFTN